MKPYNRERPPHKKFQKRKPRPLSFDQMMRKFKKKIEKTGVLQEVKKRATYEKPAQRKQRKKKEAVRREQIRHEADSLSSRRYY